MPIHIGDLIKTEAEKQKVSQEALGQLISRSKQNVNDIYKRQSIDTELLFAISRALQFDFFEVYYSEEPLKSMREIALAGYQKELEELRKLLERKEERIKDLEETVSSNKKLIHLLEEERGKYKKETGKK
jgi:transcriptional regulator with XRE-family HTH domain